MNSKEHIKQYFKETAHERLLWQKRNRFYHRSLEKYFSFIIPAGSRVLELGCETGDLLHAVKPGYGVGIDFSEEMILNASTRYPVLHFIQADVEELSDQDERISGTFDYIILSDLLHILVGCSEGASTYEEILSSWNQACYFQLQFPVGTHIEIQVNG